MARWKPNPPRRYTEGQSQKAVTDYFQVLSYCLMALKGSTAGVLAVWVPCVRLFVFLACCAIGSARQQTGPWQN